MVPGGVLASGQGCRRESAALFSYAISYITNTGSEGPASELGTVAWEPDPGTTGVPACSGPADTCGPEGTVARKLYRTKNYSDDYVYQGDTTLYFVDVIETTASSCSSMQCAPAT